VCQARSSGKLAILLLLTSSEAPPSAGFFWTRFVQG
jgi:hypothetical protein